MMQAEDDEADELEHVEEEAEDDKGDEEEKEMKQEEEKKKKEKKNEKEDEDKRAKQDVCSHPFMESITKVFFCVCVCPFSTCKPRNMHPPNTISLHSLVHTSFHSGFTSTPTPVI